VDGDAKALGATLEPVQVGTAIGVGKEARRSVIAALDDVQWKSVKCYPGASRHGAILMDQRRNTYRVDGLNWPQ
jgi:hypothetical protein